MYSPAHDSLHHRKALSQTLHVAGSLALALVAIACSTDPDQPASRDSAGVRIVENQEPLWPTAAALALSDTPTLAIGNEQGEEYQLNRVVGAVRLSDGAIVIADGGSAQLRFFDSTGKFIHAAGRSGDGPGEFRQLSMFVRLAGDTLVAGARITGAAHSYFTGSGTFVRQGSQFDLPDEGSHGLRLVMAVFDDQSLLVMPNSEPRPPPDTKHWVHTASFFHVSRDGTHARPLGDFPVVSLANTSSGLSGRWFSPEGAFTTNGTSLISGFGNEYAIRFHSTLGTLERVVRRKWEPRRVTSDDIESFVREWSARWVTSSGAEAEREKRELRASAFADTVPAFSQILVDREKRLWVRDVNLTDVAWAGNLGGNALVPSVWSVFDADGVWLCDVQMPAHFMPKDIGSDYVLGVARDVEGVERVVMYGLAPRG